MTKEQSTSELRNLALLLAAAVVATAIAIIAMQRGGYVAVGAICVLVALAAFAGGSGVGFIFGLPRVFSDDAQGAKAAAAPAEGGQPKRLMKSNANLERISDWLTTMIVGVALTQLHNLGDALYAFQTFLRAYSATCPAQNACDAGVLTTAGPIILILGAVGGFLFMYLYTRLVLTPVFNRIEGSLENLSAAATANVLSSGLPRDARAAPMAVPPDRPLSVEAALQLMFSALYQAPPEGFQRALQIAAVLSNSSAVKRADYWFYQAAAFGQQLNFLRARKKAETLDDLGPDEQSALDNAIDCAQRAVRIDPAYKARLVSIADRNGHDDDLWLVAKDDRWPGIVR